VRERRAVTISWTLCRLSASTGGNDEVVKPSSRVSARASASRASAVRRRSMAERAEIRNARASVSFGAPTEAAAVALLSMVGGSSEVGCAADWQSHDREAFRASRI
jgi:hypothetical protein